MIHHHRLGGLVEIVVRVASDELPVDLASLRSWLTEEHDLRGRVQVVPAAPEPGELGGLSDARLWLTSGGARAMRAGCGAEVAENWPGHTFVA
ncbi:effector-associated constant component EACC1 [Nocardia pneumoniae]|uniref:effector-associated constant component EACC1 n=1 Tax=Nocardia pneumoniae TaxID=228601 RepID=UPI0035712C46